MDQTWPDEEESPADDSLYICGSTGHPFKLSTLVIAVCAQVNSPTRRSRVGYVGKLDSPLNKLKVTAVVYLYRFNSAAARRIGSRKSRGTPVPAAIYECFAANTLFYIRTCYARSHGWIMEHAYSLYVIS